MYKVITSLWSKPTSPSKTQLSSDVKLDEDSWVFVSETVMVASSVKSNHVMTNSWIASPPLIKNDDSSNNVHHLNPIENLLIEHASMSVYEQIASKTRNRRQRNIMNDDKLNEDEDERTSINFPHSNVTSIHNRNLNLSSNSSVTTLESSTSSLVAHHRHLHRLHHRRKRANKSSTSKLLLTNSIDDPKQVSNKSLERQQRLNHPRTPKLLLEQPSRLYA